MFFAKQREQTDELVTAIEKELKEREDGWTPEALEKACIEMLDKMESRLRELTVEFLYENRGIFSRSNDDIKNGARFWFLDCEIPAGFSLHQKSSFQAGVTRLLYAKIQGMMLKQNWIEPVVPDEDGRTGGSASHHFFIVAKPGCKMPADEAAVEALAEEQCRQMVESCTGHFILNTLPPPKLWKFP